MLSIILAYTLWSFTYNINMNLYLPFYCKEEKPSVFSGGKCYDSKHIGFISLALILLVIHGILRYQLRQLFSSRNMFSDLPVAKFGDSFLLVDFFLDFVPPFVLIVEPWGEGREVLFAIVAEIFFYKIFM